MSMNHDAVVIGGGHAGCEAALALARIGHRTLLLTTNLDNIAYLACNPSIGGTAKGHIVREVDALGGEMGVNADSTLLQLRMLNLGKGVAVHSLRAQTDKNAYHTRMKSVLENTENLTIYQAEAIEILHKNMTVCGVKLATGIVVETRTVVVSSGVYLSSDIIMGEYRKNIGPSGFAPANLLSKNLADLGMEIRRFKTGTPARIHSKSIDFTKMERQNSDQLIYSFSFMNENVSIKETPCYLTYTTQKTHDIIRENLHRAPMYSGMIKGIGPRYCPSIEDKVVRFSDKERHQVFIEPEDNSSVEMYVQGMSTSMPIDVQEKMYKSVIGLENAVIMRNAYAIEYDCINAQQLTPWLKYKNANGLYFAGQVNGSSGYEEAAGQGILAGINASLYLRNMPPLELYRSDAYIGVLVDDLTIKGTLEPYRMMTSRAEYRLHLRQDNADQRLTQKGRDVGLVSDERYDRYMRKMEEIQRLKTQLEVVVSPKKSNVFMEENAFEPLTTGCKLKELLRRYEISIDMMKHRFGLSGYSDEVLRQAETEIKYEGYLVKQKQEIEKTKRLEDRCLSADIDYFSIKGLRIEAAQKLNKHKPSTVAQAGRISGVSPADVAILLMYLSK